jgi:hypothetical protein
MTLVLCSANSAGVMGLSGHFKTGPFVFFPVARFPTENLALGSLKSDDRQVGRPTASPSLSLLG